MDDNRSTTKRGHRGRHPDDDELLAPACLPILRTAVDELSWLLDRGYSDPAALKLVGDRHELRKRQRTAVMRAACSDTARAARAARKLTPRDMAGRALALDGFNCIITLEAAMSGGPVLIGRDRAHRDLSSVHGSYRRVAETERAVAAVAARCADMHIASAHWLLDRPVSNSGRLKAVIEAAAPSDIPWTVELAYSPDQELLNRSDWVVATSDAWILDHCGPWLDIPGATVGPDAWIVDLGQSAV